MIYLFLILFFSFNIGFGVSVSEVSQDNEFHGKTLFYLYDKEDPQMKEGFSHSVTLLDNTGKVKSIKMFKILDKDTQIIFINKIFKDDKTLVLYAYTNSFIKKHPYYKKIFTYNAKGEKESVTFFYTNSYTKQYKASFRLVSFDNKGKPIKETFYDNDYKKLKNRPTFY